MDISQILAQLGNPGRYAVLVFIMMCCNNLQVALNHLAMSIFGATLPHRCKLPSGYSFSNETVPTLANGQLDMCNVFANYSLNTNHSVPCPDGWEYSFSRTEIPNGPHESTIVNEWDLICNKKWLVSLSTTIYFTGVTMGGILFGCLSDIYGRRPIILLTLFTPVLLGVMLFFVKNFILFNIIRFLIGMFAQGLQVTSYVLAFELFSDHRHRSFSSCILEVAWATGAMTLSLFSWCLKSWRWIQLCLSLSTLLSLLYAWKIPESFPWLVRKHKYGQAQKYLCTAYEYNKIKVNTSLVTHLSATISDNDFKKKYDFIDLFRTPNIRKRSFLLFYIWFATACGYYGLSLNTSSLAGDKYLNYFINGAIEVPAYLLGIYVLNRFGRRIPLTSFFLTGGIALILAGSIPKTTSFGTDISWITVSLAWIGKFSNAGCYTVIALYVSELYPTLLRNVAVGACTFCGRVGSLLAPQILLLGRETESWVSTVILGGLALLGGFVTLALPETMNMKMPETLEEADKLQQITYIDTELSADTMDSSIHMKCQHECNIDDTIDQNMS